MSIVTLTTDFGVGDTFVAQMKGVILGIAPDVAIVDLTHGIAPRDIAGAALALDAAADAFPRGAIHIAVVDPGVGSDRRGLAIATDRELLVGPDNGIFTLLLDRRDVVQAVELANAVFHREPVSPTFHGRDLFAPAAAHIARGVPLYDLGGPATGLVRLELPYPTIAPAAIDAHVLHVDPFGNLVTDLLQEDLDDWLAETADDRVSVEAGSAAISGISLTFSDVPHLAPVAYVGSSGRLEVAVNGGNASVALGAGVGATVRVVRA